MKILLATESYWPNFDGGAVFERRLALDMAKRGHEVFIIAPGKYYHNYIERDGKTTIYREKSDYLIFNLKYRISFWPFFSVPKIIKKIKPDVIHIHNQALIGWSALRTARKLKIPVLGTNHFMPENALLNVPHIFSKPLSWLIWKITVGFYNKCNFVTSPTKTAVDLLVKAGLKSPSMPISNGVDLSIFKPAENMKQEYKKQFRLPMKPVVLYLGRVNKEKRLDIFLKSVPEVLKKVDCTFLIVGDGNAVGELKNLAKDLQIEKNVIFYGRVSEEDKPKIYQLSDVFAISSPAELQSIVMLEAIATGLPVVSCNVCALPELAHEGRNGCLFSLEDYCQMAEGIVKVLKTPALKEKMGKESLEIIKEHSEIKTHDKFEKIYKELKEGKYA